MSLSETAGRFFDPREIGKITKDEVSALSPAAELLRRADEAWLQWGELNEAVENMPADRVDEETREKINVLLLTLHEHLKKLNFDNIDPGALNELRAIHDHSQAIADEVEDKDRPDYFSATDLAVSTQKGGVMGWGKRVIVEGGEQERRAARLTVAKTVEKVITEKKLTAATNQLLVIECAVTLGSAKLVGPLQQLAAKNCAKVWQRYIADPAPERLAKLKQAHESLQQSLDVEGLVRRAEENADGLEAALTKRATLQGIAANDLLATQSARQAEPAMQAARAAVEVAAKTVQETVQAALNTLAEKLATLKQTTQQSGSDVDLDGNAFAAVSAIFDNGNLARQPWVQNCDNALEALAKAMQVLSKMLNVRMELPPHEAAAPLPAHEIVDAELADYDNEINPEVARELGLVKKELRAFPEATQLIREIVEKKCDPNTKDGQEHLCAMWPEDCPPPFVPPEGKWWHKFYPETPYPVAFSQDERKKGNFWYVEQLYAGTIVANLEGEKQPFVPEYGEQTVFVPSRPDEDWDATTGKQKKLQTEDYNDKLLNLLLAVAKKEPHIGAVNISRETIDNLLWLGDPGERIPSAMQAKVLKTLTGDNWKNWEIRNANQREIEGKHNLWTHMDGYFLGGGGGRYGLLGGYRKYGGASRVAYYWRDRAAGNCAVRLVLSRKRG